MCDAHTCWQTARERPQCLHCTKSWMRPVLEQPPSAAPHEQPRPDVQIPGPQQRAISTVCLQRGGSDNFLAVIVHSIVALLTNPRPQICRLISMLPPTSPSCEHRREGARGAQWLIFKPLAFRATASTCVSCDVLCDLRCASSRAEVQRLLDICCFHCRTLAILRWAVGAATSAWARTLFEEVREGGMLTNLTE